MIRFRFFEAPTAGEAPLSALCSLPALVAAGRRLTLALGLSLLLASHVACRPGKSTPDPMAAVEVPRAHQGPIVLITLSGVRLDALSAFGGREGLTPTFDRLLAESVVGPRAIASTSRLEPATLSLLTGVEPPLSCPQAAPVVRVEDHVRLLPDYVRALGYRTRVFHSGWLSAAAQIKERFDEAEPLRTARGARSALRSLTNDRELIWIHDDIAQPPFQDAPSVRDKLAALGPLPAVARDAPKKVRVSRVLPFFDPGRKMAPRFESWLQWLYDLAVGRADTRLDGYLRALEASGVAGETLLIVVGDAGTEINDYGQVLHGGSLGRKLIEVPGAIRMPTHLLATRNIGESPRSTARWPAAGLVSTVHDLLGVDPPSATVPSVTDGEVRPILSVLPLRNGSHSFSLVDGDLRLSWESQFARPQRGYYREWAGAARKDRLEGPAVGALREACERTDPVFGLGEPQRRLDRWHDDGRVEPVEDPAELERLTELFLQRIRSTDRTSLPQRKEIAPLVSSSG